MQGAEARIGNFTITTTPTQTQIDLASTLLGDEFYAKSPVQGIDKFRKSIDAGESKLTCVMEGEKLVAAGTHKIYDWAKLRKQLYYEPLYDESGFMISARLRRLEELLSDNGLPAEHQLAGEIAYLYVKPESRGKKYGRSLFESQVKAMQAVPSLSMLFTLAMGPYAQTHVPDTALAYMLEQEGKQNGYGADGRPQVNGIFVSTNDIMMACGGQHYQIDQLSSYTGSEATVHMAKSMGFIPLGFSKNFSPLWVKPI